MEELERLRDARALRSIACRAFEVGVENPLLSVSETATTKTFLDGAPKKCSSVYLVTSWNLEILDGKRGVLYMFFGFNHNYVIMDGMSL